MGISLATAMRCGAWAKKIAWVQKQEPVEIELPTPEPPPPPPPPPPPLPLSPPPSARIHLKRLDEDQQRTLDAWIDAREHIWAMIKQVVCGAHGVTEEDLISESRKRREAVPRQIICYLGMCHTPLGWSEMGRRLHRDHSTVHHACLAISERRATEPALNAAITRIEEQLQAMVQA